MGMLDGLLKEVTSSVSGSSGPQQGLAGSVINMLTSNPGGLENLIQTMEQKGLGSIAQSWVGTGANHAITAEQIQSVLGNQQLQQLAAQHGLDLQDVSNHLAQILPVVVDKLTPNGQVPNAGGVASLLQGFMGANKPT
jgi:uncharacterized protein YidB (DUF937 family)